MSRTSISKNNLAKDEIDKAIASYSSALSSIKVNNNNSKVNEIEKLINQNKIDLIEAKKHINSINTQINNELNELARKEKEAKEKKEKAGE